MYYYTVYQTTNQANGKIYIGIHKTDDVHDSYIGSGKLLKAAIKKYGKSSFTKQILYVFDSLDDAVACEKDIVNEDFISRPDTYNICVGGGLGSREINGLTFKDRYHTDGTKQKISSQMKGNKHSVGRKISEDHKAKIAEASSKTHKGVKKTPEHRKKISDSIRDKWNDPAYRGKSRGKGSRKPFMWITNGVENRRYTPMESCPIPDGWVRGKSEATVWITDGHTSIKIKNTDDIPDGWRRGRVL